MKKALLLFGIAGCFCTGIATKSMTGSGRASELWSEIKSGAITELEEHHLEGLSNNQRIVTLDKLIKSIYESPSPRSLAMNYLIDHMRVQVDALRLSKILRTGGIILVICMLFIGALFIGFPKPMKHIIIFS